MEPLFGIWNQGSHIMEEKKSVATEKEEGPLVMVLTHNTQETEAKGPQV